MKTLVIILTLLMLDRVLASEFSVRCEGKAPAGLYYATFNTDAKAVVFETASANGSSFDGTNVLAGDIIDAGPQADGRLSFVLRAPDGKVNLIFDAKNNSMIWPGITGSDPFRPTLTHACLTTPPRSILSFRNVAANLHPISIRCAESGYMYFTVDIDSKRAIYERDHGGMYSGEVTGVQGDDLSLLMNFNTPTAMQWNISRHAITLDAIDSRGEKSRKTTQCEFTAPRTMIDYYSRLK